MIKDSVKQIIEFTLLASHYVVPVFLVYRNDFYMKVYISIYKNRNNYKEISTQVLTLLIVGDILLSVRY